MQKDIHPKTQKANIKCISCGKEYSFFSTNKDITVDVCANCHPFYQGTTVSLKSAGRVDKFKNKLAKSGEAKKTQK